VRDHNGQALGQIITASITNESADELKLESHEAILRASATPIVARRFKKD
jgi:molybdopterin-binding protein